MAAIASDAALRTVVFCALDAPNVIARRATYREKRHAGLGTPRLARPVTRSTLANNSVLSQRPSGLKNLDRDRTALEGNAGAGHISLKP